MARVGRLLSDACRAERLRALSALPPTADRIYSTTRDSIRLVLLKSNPTLLSRLLAPKSNANANAATASVFARGRAQICRRGKGPPLHASREDRPNSAAGPVATAASRPSQVAAGRAGPAACGGGHLAPRGGRKKRNSRDRTSIVFTWRRIWNHIAENFPKQINWLRFTPMQ